MTTSTAPAADSENRKVQLIVATARQLFLKNGYDKTSMDQIARNAGVSKATLYVYFRSKEALLLALITDESRSMDPRPIWEAGLEVPDLVATLRSIAERFTTRFLTDSGLALHRLITAQATQFPEIGRAFYESGPKKVHDEVRAFLALASDAKLLAMPDVELAATQFISLVRGDLPLNWTLALERPSQVKITAQIESGIQLFLAAYRCNETCARDLGP